MDCTNFVFTYTITIKNTGTVPAQLISRHWVITDAINASVRDWLASRPGTHYFEVDEMVMTCGQYGGVAVASAEASALPGSRCENYADDFGHFRRPGYGVIYSALRGDPN